LKAAGLKRVEAIAVELVAARLHDHLKRHAGRRNFRIVSRWVDDHLVDGAHVVVAGGAVGIDAVEHQRRSAIARSVVDERAASAAGVIAADVGDAGHAHARRELAHVLIAAGRRQDFDDVFLDVRRHRGRPHVDHRRLTGDGDVFLNLADGHADIDRRHEPGIDVDVGPGDFLETRQREGQHVEAAWQRREPVASAVVGLGVELWRLQRRTGNGDRDPGQGGAAVVDHFAFDRRRVGRRLCAQRRWRQQRRRDAQHEDEGPPGSWENGRRH
jgi:hypothetical protein